MTTQRPRGRPVKAKHLDALVANLHEVVRLVDIHTSVAGKKAGKKHDVEVLNKSGVVLLVACWEAFVEDLAERAFELLLRRALAPDQFGKMVLAQVAKQLRKDPNERKVWDLAGSGWKSVLRNHRQEILLRHVGRLNTPMPENIDNLFGALFDISRISRSWSWSRVTPAKARSRLARLVRLRGTIAHRVSTPHAVRKRVVVRETSFVGRLSAATHNSVSRQLKLRLGYEVWQQVRYAPNED